MRRSLLLLLPLVVLLTGCSRAPAETWRVKLVVRDWLGVNQGLDLVGIDEPVFAVGRELRGRCYLFSITDAGHGRRKIRMRCVPPGIPASLDAPVSTRGGDLRVFDATWVLAPDQVLVAETARINARVSANRAPQALP
jgi:hypothetical protein